MDSIYCYPGSNVLINKLDIRDAEELYKVERGLTGLRLVELGNHPITGNFDFAHLSKIHAHLFQDIYEWAGQLREVMIGKNGDWFLDPREIKGAFDYLHQQCSKEHFLRHIMNIDTFCDRLAYYAAEINEYHPFREGNGRSTREFVRTLAKQAGYDIDFSSVDYMDVYHGFVSSFGGKNYADLSGVFKKMVKGHIVSQYESEFPAIGRGSDTLFNNLQVLKMTSEDKEFPSLGEISKEYNRLGAKIEDGSLDISNPDFKRLSDVMLEVIKIGAQEPSQDAVNLKTLQCSFDPEL